MDDDDFSKYFSFLVFDEKYEYDELIKKLSKHIADNPSNAKAFNNRGIAYWEIGKDERALEDITKSIVLCPEDSIQFLNRAEIYERQGQLKEAASDYAMAIQLSGEDPFVYRTRAEFCLERGDLHQAIEDYTKAIALDPEHPYTYEQRAKAYESLGQTERAAADREAAQRAQVAIDLYKARKRDLAEGFICPDTGTRFRSGSLVGEWGVGEEGASAEWGSGGPILRQGGNYYKFTWQGEFVSRGLF